LKLEKLISEREVVGVHLQNIRQATDNKRENISKMAAQALALREKGAEYTLSSQIADSRTAYALSLYAKISNITWDYQATPGKIAGCKYCVKFGLITELYSYQEIIEETSLNKILILFTQVLETTKPRHLKLSTLIPVPKHLLRWLIPFGI
jgi:hypothetical protein